MRGIRKMGEPLTEHTAKELLVKLDTFQREMAEVKKMIIRWTRENAMAPVSVDALASDMAKAMEMTRKTGDRKYVNEAKARLKNAGRG